jgi:hypothetical protein
MILREPRRMRVPWICAALGGVLCASGLYSPDLLRAQMPTAERLLYRGWWPRRSIKSDDTCAGPAECAACHREKVATEKDTPMAGASTAIVLGAEPDLLATHDRLTLYSGSIGYQIVISNGRAVCTLYTCGPLQPYCSAGCALSRLRIGSESLWRVFARFRSGPVHANPQSNDTAVRLNLYLTRL